MKLTSAKALVAANDGFRRADPFHHLDDAVAEALQTKIFKGCTADGERALTPVYPEPKAVARQCADAQAYLDRPSVQHALISARAQRLRGK